MMVRFSVIALLVLLTVLAWPQVIQAEEPVLAVRLADGGDHLYWMSDLERIQFQTYYDVEELVVFHSLGTDNYPVASIAKIDFIWNTTSVDNPEDAAAMIKAVHLFQNQPNPFSPETQIRFELPQAGRVELEIYDVSGRLIRTLVNQEQDAGSHLVNWDGRNDAGRKVPGGVYFYNLTAPGIEESRRMILLP